MFIHCSLLKLFTTVFIGQTRGGSKRKAEGQPETEAGIQPKKAKATAKATSTSRGAPHVLVSIPVTDWNTYFLGRCDSRKIN